MLWHRLAREVLEVCLGLLGGFESRETGDSAQRLGILSRSEIDISGAKQWLPVWYFGLGGWSLTLRSCHRLGELEIYRSSDPESEAGVDYW